MWVVVRRGRGTETLPWHPREGREKRGGVTAEEGRSHGGCLEERGGEKVDVGIGVRQTVWKVKRGGDLRENS